MAEPLLAVENLDLVFDLPAGTVKALNQVSFPVARGQVTGLVGESGSGKSTLARSLLRVLPANARITGGRVLLEGRELTGLPESEMRQVRWAQISMVFQSAINALNPVIPVGAQITEAIRLHGGTCLPDTVPELLRQVGLDAGVARAYAHQLSGGMRQRVLVAMAMALKPPLIIADEPTTALDVITQDRVLRRLISLQRQNDGAVLLITHDMAVLAQHADYVVVLYAGEVMEAAPIRRLFRAGGHPYTLGLLNAIPSRHQTTPLVSIPGGPPALHERGHACPFAPRCPFAAPICRELRPPASEVAPGHLVSCHFPERAEEFRLLVRRPETWESPAGSREAAACRV